MIDLGQWKRFVVVPSLTLLGMVPGGVGAALAAPWAINQMTGTTKESGGVQYLYQVPNGPAIGPYQMEPATHDDIWINFLPYNLNIRSIILRETQTYGVGHASLMFTDMLYATMMARIDYWRSKLPAPSNTAIALATYHKDVFNTALGASVASEDVAYYQAAIEA